jgi:ribosome-binding protein aMBF1 (putative translation factor)
MKETIVKCNECGAEITGYDPLLTYNGEEIDLCSDQCRLKWWMSVVEDAEAAGREIHIISKAEEKKAEQPDSAHERNLKMLPGK